LKKTKRGGRVNGQGGEVLIERGDHVTLMYHQSSKKRKRKKGKKQLRRRRCPRDRKRKLRTVDTRRVTRQRE